MKSKIEFLKQVKNTDVVFKVIKACRGKHLESQGKVQRENFKAGESAASLFNHLVAELAETNTNQFTMPNTILAQVIGCTTSKLSSRMKTFFREYGMGDFVSTGKLRYNIFKVVDANGNELETKIKSEAHYTFYFSTEALNLMEAEGILTDVLDYNKLRAEVATSQNLLNQIANKKSTTVQITQYVNEYVSIETRIEVEKDFLNKQGSFEKHSTVVVTSDNGTVDSKEFESTSNTFVPKAEVKEESQSVEETVSNDSEAEVLPTSEVEEVNVEEPASTVEEPKAEVKDIDSNVNEKLLALLDEEDEELEWLELEDDEEDEEPANNNDDLDTDFDEELVSNNSESVEASSNEVEEGNVQEPASTCEDEFLDFDGEVTEEELSFDMFDNEDAIEASSNEVEEGNVQEPASTVEEVAASNNNAPEASSEDNNDLDFDDPDFDPEAKTANVTFSVANMGKHGAMKANRTHTSDEPKSSTNTREARRNMRKGFGNQQVASNDFDFEDEFKPNKNQLRGIRKAMIMEDRNNNNKFGFKGNLPTRRHQLKK